MHIIPHPYLLHPDTIESEYAMVDDILKIQVRTTVAGYVLRHWNINCSTTEHSLIGANFTCGYKIFLLFMDSII